LKTSLTHLRAVSLRERAEMAIRASIVTGEITAGEIYPAAYFAERLGVSATPVREALINLANENLVEAVRNRGFRVPVLSDWDLDEILSMRLLLEIPSIGQVAERFEPEDAKEFGLIVDRTRQSAEEGDLNAFLEQDRSFHLSLLGVLNNRRLIDTVGRLRDEARLYGLRGLSHSLLLAAAQEHHELLEAVCNHNRARAERVTRKHLENTRGAWAGARGQGQHRVGRGMV
jgi:DNA-binding GntR family transcriptional regulator